jgi:hypothetical protein
MNLRIQKVFMIKVFSFLYLFLFPITSFALNRNDYEEIRFDTSEMNYVLIHKNALKDPAYPQFKAVFDQQVRKVLDVLPLEARQFIRDIPIWIENDPKAENTAVYYSGGRWRVDNQENASKQKSITVLNIHYFMQAAKVYDSWVLLHEMAHAYHDQKIGFQEPSVIAAYENAKIKNLYAPGRLKDGRTVPSAYALTNPREYFAEMTEAYFGVNDYYPHSREELRDYDRPGFDIMKNLWR